MLKGVITALHVLIAMGLIAVVLLQSGRSAGLGAIAGGAEAIFGKKKGLDELLAKLTVLTGVLFAVTSLLLGLWH
ncbi:preprotein translocase subunit SecG [Desulfurispora thermophila]|uniref:preprotein translocase subunit SecG n=1 Tax=Desulfurispora thermophila TaxID=265470 RepID=UPI00037287B5|nr:preprotein translocase subunit SecG [Desulfurispora thermophila]